MKQWRGEVIVYQSTISVVSLLSMYLRKNNIFTKLATHTIGYHMHKGHYENERQYKIQKTR